jgi:HAE1 family hydrophobic/amphiphilic exporter-1
MISAIFIKRPILSTVLSIIVVIAGIVSMYGLPINQNPAITPSVQVTRVLMPKPWPIRLPLPSRPR